MEADDISVKSINCILFKEKHIYQKINEKNINKTHGVAGVQHHVFL